MYTHVVTPVADDSRLTGFYTYTHLCRLHSDEESGMQTIGEHWEALGRPVVPTPMNLSGDWLSLGLRIGPVGIRG